MVLPYIAGTVSFLIGEKNSGVSLSIRKDKSTPPCGFCCCTPPEKKLSREYKLFKALPRLVYFQFGQWNQYLSVDPKWELTKVFRET